MSEQTSTREGFRRHAAQPRTRAKLLIARVIDLPDGHLCHQKMMALLMAILKLPS